MLTRANELKDHILITGASGGVGSALIQPAKEEVPGECNLWKRQIRSG